MNDLLIAIVFILAILVVTKVIGVFKLSIAIKGSDLPSVPTKPPHSAKAEHQA